MKSLPGIIIQFKSNITKTKINRVTKEIHFGKINNKMKWIERKVRSSLVMRVRNAKFGSMAVFEGITCGGKKTTTVFASLINYDI